VTPQRENSIGKGGEEEKEAGRSTNHTKYEGAQQKGSLRDERGGVKKFRKARDWEITLDPGNAYARRNELNNQK